MNYELHPEALVEYEAAIAYYAERDPAVARRFVAVVERRDRENGPRSVRSLRENKVEGSL